MKQKISTTLILLISIITLNYSCAQAKNKTHDKLNAESARAELESLNKRIEHLYSNKETDSVIRLYSEKFTLLPEYKPAIVEIKSLNQFYKDWFDAINNIIYKKSIYKVEMFSDYVLEIGNFTLNYSTKQNPKNNYTGKYMIMWKRNAQMKLNILSEAFGSDKLIKPEDVPYAGVQVKEIFVLDKNIINDELRSDVEEFDKTLTNAVVDGNGKARADGFTKDGIYMPHFGSILEGMDVLLPYMMKTYTPSSKLYVRNTYREIFNMGEFVFLNGHFKGGWGDPASGGTFEGNMSNLMKRNAKGKLLMYRQLANNDR
jgi:ketosteroid isomerase-like protein